MKILIRFLTALLIFILISLISIYVMFRQSLPKTNGALKMTGIDKEIKITRNQWGVPHVEAQSIEDLYFAIGFLQASDRLFQMDMSRRMATGRLSEIFGQRTLDYDKYKKELLIEESIEKLIVHCDSKIKRLLQCYCHGINAYMKSQKLPPEFILLDYEPEPWQIHDSFTILKNMEHILAGSGSELYNFQVRKSMKSKNLDQIINEQYGISIINSTEYQKAVSENESLMLALDEEISRRESFVGSNNWVISGRLTNTGQPFLANDLHLPVVFPSYFYQLSGKIPSREFSGNTLPGTPFIVVGRNGRIGWGVTNIGTDVIDYFILKINPENKNQYFFNGQWHDFTTIEKIIKIKGKKPINHKIKYSEFGPVFTKDNLYLARHSLNLYPTTTVTAIYKMNMADNISTFVQALRNFSSPALNVVFSDITGNIGYFPTGKIPLRSKGDGALPIYGDDQEDLWQGFYQEEEKPFLLNPEKGYIITANNPVVPANKLPLFQKSWNPVFRAERIEELVLSKPVLSMTDMKKIQTDIFMKNAEFLINKITEIKNEITSSNARHIFNKLIKWNLKAESGIEPSLFLEFENYLARNIFKDHFIDNQHSLISTSWLYIILNYPQSTISKIEAFNYWIDNLKTENMESFSEIVEQSLIDTYHMYKSHQDATNLNWNNIHKVYYRHPLGSIPFLNIIFNRGPFAISGASGCIAAANMKKTDIPEVSYVSTFRMILDFSNSSNSVNINSSGQSGHFMSDNYDDQIDLFIKHQYRQMEDFKGKIKILTLIPQ